MKRSPGFTLLEVLIAMMILAFVVVFTAQSIQRALQSRNKIQGEIEKTSSARDALRIMENDINRAFHFHDYTLDLYNETAKARNKKIEEAKAKGGPPTNPGPGGITVPTQPSGPDPYATMEPLKLKQEVNLTHFLGARDSLNFTSTSNARMTSEERTSDLAEIGYFLRECRIKSISEQKNHKCLVRRVSAIIDDDITKGGEETDLLENIEKLEFRYLGPNMTKEWTQTWFTNEQGDEATKNIFPYAVEINIEVTDPRNEKAKPLKMTLVAGIRNPNNLKPKEPEAGQNNGNPDGPNSPKPNQPGGTRQ